MTGWAVTNVKEHNPHPQTGRFHSNGGWGSSSWPWSPACASCQAAGRFWQRDPKCQRSPWLGAPGPWELWQSGLCSGSCSLYWTGSDPASHWLAPRRRRPLNLEIAVRTTSAFKFKNNTRNSDGTFQKSYEFMIWSKSNTSCQKMLQEWCQESHISSIWSDPPEFYCPF